MAGVTVTPEAEEGIGRLPAPIKARVDRLLARLEWWPSVSDVKWLRGELAGRARLRTGDYRVQFRVQETRQIVKEEKVVKGKKIVEEKEVVEYQVVVEKVGHRRDFYES